MTKAHLNTLLIAVCCIALFACKEAAEQKPAAPEGLADAFETDTMIMQTDDGKTYEFDIYVARDNEQHRRGLMFVRSMPERTGMLFVYDTSDTRSIWMKNTYISLDLIFARGDGSVSSVVRDTQPLSLVPHPSTEPIDFILELNSGTALRYRIGKNSRIIWED